MKSTQNGTRSHTSRLFNLSLLVLPGALSCAVVVAQCAPNAAAKSPNWELIPPPPPTPVMEVPPPPVMVPYSYALQGGPELVDQPSTFTAPATMPSIVRPKPPQPQPKPRPTGLRPINAPNLNVSYAASRGFGEPRFGYDSKDAHGAGAVEAYPGIPSAAPLNPWFDASLRWYANHVNEQQFYSNLAAKNNPFGAPNNQLAATYTSTYNANAPQAVSHPTHSGHHHRRHEHRVFASR